MTTQPDLFPDAFQDSPYIEFVERHGIITGDVRTDPGAARIRREMNQYPDADDDYYFFAHSPGYDSVDDALDDCDARFGKTKRDAVLELAYALRLDGREGI